MKLSQAQDAIKSRFLDWLSQSLAHWLHEQQTSRIGLVPADLDPPLLSWSRSLSDWCFMLPARVSYNTSNFLTRRHQTEVLFSLRFHALSKIIVAVVLSKLHTLQ